MNMIRRTIALLALAFAAALAPIAAQASQSYPAPEDALTCSSAQVAPGTPFSCQVGGENGAQAQLQTTTSGDDATIAGTVTSEVKVIANNVAKFTVTPADVEGEIGVTAIINGVAVDTAVIVVAATGTGGASEGGGDGLAGTGFENGGLAVGAGVLLVLGAGAVLLAARRRSAKNSR
ncbi:hypothetical protein [Demequina aurantiaca]|uniref:hypothetical protein n=1 Tax=Demequina aurantiaca TaxID=676200 RepID=UPI003D32BB8D